MAAAAPSGLSTSAAVFAGGLAVGIGGAFALSRSVFSPSSKPTRSTQQKARRDLSLPNGDAGAKDVVSTLAAPHDVPASKELDGVDSKGSGPAVPKSETAIVKPVLSRGPTSGGARVLKSITGKDVVPEPSGKNRMEHVNTKMDLASASNDSVAETQAPSPVPKAGTEAPQGLDQNTSTGQIDKLAYQSSKAVFVYESSTNAGFGSHSEREARQAEAKGVPHAKVVSMQTRAGAGAAIAGYLAEKGNSSSFASKEGADIVSALTNSDGFLAMAPSLATLASSNGQTGRLVLQVSGASHTRDDQVSNNYAAVLTAANTVGDDFSVVLSGGSDEAVAIAAAVSAAGVQGNVAHVFDGAFAGTQEVKAQVSIPKIDQAPKSAVQAVQAAGFANFEYSGPAEPRSVLIVPNGSHHDAARNALASASKDIKDSLGVIAVRVIRPWSDEDLLKLISASVEQIHVLDEVRVAGMTGVLYEDIQSTVLGSIFGGKNSTSAVVQPIALRAGEHLSPGHWNLLLKGVASSKEQWKVSQLLPESEEETSSSPDESSPAPLPDAAANAGVEPSATRATWALPAWQLMFAEAYKTQDKSLRPDLPEDNYVLTVTENKRLTPLDYDRNVFHMELSTAGTGLKYEVGEALGIHGWNDAEEVKEFIERSGYDADEILSVPSLNNSSRFESRTVFQILQQRLDIFGKPPKRFYEELSKLATDVDEAKWLRFIGSAEGQSTFRKLSEVETVTYADVLQMFPSARVPLDMLLQEVEPIKPRHYSIASAQSFVGDSVHLLIVTVDWRTPSGSPRYGQCTRYLANLKIGEQVTVSLKPSVMKLPPHTTQPIVMSGLGTGAAPFRAYIQARAVQKRLGHKIGPMIYIFGSRYKHAEYLYGEELEAYEKDGIVKVLTAFSRDQKNKIYIQHRIEQNQKEILDLLMPEKNAGGEEVQGLFTLCGPTDPLPDVQEALIKGYMSKTGKTHADGQAWLEELKEAERAVYEVY